MALADHVQAFPLSPAPTYEQRAKSATSRTILISKPDEAIWTEVPVEDVFTTYGGGAFDPTADNIVISKDFSSYPGIEFDALSHETSWTDGQATYIEFQSGNVKINAGGGAANIELTGAALTFNGTAIAGSPEAWIEVGSGGAAPAFQNGATNFGGSTPTVAFYKDRGRVYFKGVVTGFGDVADTVIFTLPVGYRPAQRVIHEHYAIDTDGSVQFKSTGGLGLNSLDGLDFRAA